MRFVAELIVALTDATGRIVNGLGKRSIGKVRIGESIQLVVIVGGEVIATVFEGLAIAVGIVSGHLCGLIRIGGGREPPLIVIIVMSCVSFSGSGFSLNPVGLFADAVVDDLSKRAVIVGRLCQTIIAVVLVIGNDVLAGAVGQFAGYGLRFLVA